MKISLLLEQKEDSSTSPCCFTLNHLFLLSPNLLSDLVSVLHYTTERNKTWSGEEAGCDRGEESEESWGHLDLRLSGVRGQRLTWRQSFHGHSHFNHTHRWVFMCVVKVLPQHVVCYMYSQTYKSVQTKSVSKWSYSTFSYRFMGVHTCYAFRVQQSWF